MTLPPAGRLINVMINMFCFEEGHFASVSVIMLLAAATAAATGVVVEWRA